MADPWYKSWLAPWSREDVPPTREEIPELPGTFPSEAPDFEARPRSETYEFPLPTVNNNSEFSHLTGPNLTSPFYDSPLLVAPQKVSFATTPNRDETSSLSETGKSTKKSIKNSSSPKLRKGSKTTATSSSNDIVIAVFGLTGSGKSNFISKLTGKDVKIGHGLQSCTSEIEEVRCKIGLCNVTLVDTPGFDDSNRTDTEILRLIASWMKDAYDDKTRLTGIIYLHRISDNKMSGSSYKNLKMLRSLCGMSNLSHVTLATTMWDKVTTEEGGLREAELLSEDEWWGQMKNNGSLVRRFDDTTGGAMAIVNELLQMSPVVLKIQEEIAVQKKQLVETQAGRSIDASLNDESRKQRGDLAEVTEDLANAIETKDRALQAELEATKKKLADQVAATEESKRELRRPINRRAWWRLSWK
ncbi:hypothetical protein MMC29_007122, partial [Sticta canariensis]|nr:hypothetical protein [Sticta canariensis]